MRLSFVYTPDCKRLEGRLIYRHDEYSFDFEVAKGETVVGGTTITIDTLQIEIDGDTGCLQYIWGYWPNVLWKTSTLPAVNFLPGGIKIVPLDDVNAAIVANLEGYETWHTFYDVDSRWLCITPVEPSQLEPYQHIEFARNIAASISKEQLQALWLHPFQMP